MKKLLKLFSFIFLYFIFAKNIFAASDVIVNCNNIDCEILGSPLFNEINLLPGDNLTKVLEINNNRNEICNLNMNVTNWNESYLDFSKKFDVNIDSSKSGIIFSDSLFSLFDNQNIDIETLNSNESVYYNFDVIFDNNSGNEYQNKNIDFDFDVSFTCGDEENVTLSLQKTNNTNGFSVSPNSEVLYTLTVKTFDVPLDNVVVVDLPPNGFVYKIGSWSGTSVEPVYHSPGRWNLGNMQANQTIILTYIAQINDSVENGIYPDLAWAEGILGEDQVYANEDNDIFVGSKVIVDKNANPSVVLSAPKNSVLGASDEKILPATGANLIWIKLSVMLMFVGLSLVFYEKN